LCLERAGAVPLAIDITISDIKGDVDFLQALPPHVSRISRVPLTGHSFIEGVADDLPGFFASPMLDLTSLELKSLYLTRKPLYPALTNITFLVELKLVEHTTPFHFGNFCVFLRSNSNLEIIVLDIQFAEAPAWVSPTRSIPLAHLRRLSFTCDLATDAKDFISCISFPRGVFLEVFSSRAGDPSSFLPSLPTSIQKLLAPITTVRYRNNPRALHLSGNDSSFSFRCRPGPFDLHWYLSLFTTAAVREFHVHINLCQELFPLPLSRFPALETLVLVDVASFPSHSLDFLAE
jgi:hypothetical protein